MRVFFTLAAVVLSLGIWDAATSAQDAQFRAASRTVRVFATVQDRDGQAVPGLTAADFEVRDNGRAVPITTFANDPQPINAAILVDASANIAPRLNTVVGAASDLLNRLTATDRALLVLFGSEIAVSGSLTGDFAAMRRMLTTEIWADDDGTAALWTAMDRAMALMDDPRTRRTLLIIGDGQDWCPNGPESVYPCTPFDRIRRRALDGDYLIYVVTVNGTMRDDHPHSRLTAATADAINSFRITGQMRELVADTGGLVDRLERDADIATTFSRVVSHLRHQYLIGFVPAALDGREHRIEVRTRVSGLTVRARRSYIASKAAS